MKAAGLAPGSWLAVLGGGQLGRMFCMAAQTLGFRVCVLDPAPECPAADVADRHLQANYDDPVALAEIARTCSAATTEFENVPAEALRFLARQIRVAPSADSVAIAQNRIAEKSFLRGAGLPVGDYAVIANAQDLLDAPASLFPGILKAARFGYDGKGQVAVAHRGAAIAALAEHFSSDTGGVIECVLERRIDLASEVSVMVARGMDGVLGHWPVTRNVHCNGVLATSTVPSLVDPDIEAAAIDAALRVARTLDYTGVLGVEIFVLKNNSILINEIAPRPHNSGHWTLDASVTSQFEQQVRVLAGLPLGATDLLVPVVMLNLLGDCWKATEFDRSAQVDPAEPDWSAVLGEPMAKLHLYGKREARPGRKMGHVNVLGQAATETVVRIAQRLGASY
ncbi:MAG: 5-(carboxyamino)imidazole ribonucleotide synthase [Betaproteobacteria bacterium]|nr:5-(carboxyamino)imidazole ribonucleotide synthase [Betaproteobacteria bacterium]